jgi:NADH:ubiquinone oxidoreductase subunit 3 (subunit A)
MAVAAWVFTGFVLVGAALAYILVTLPRFLAPHSMSDAKASPYECGEVPIGEPWVHFRVAYYVFAIIFVVFDVETVFLYPWAVIFRKLGMFGFVEMAVFVGILLLGLAYAWRKGALKWS